MKSDRFKPSSQTIVLLSLLFSSLLFYALFWSGHHYSIDGVVMFQYAKALLFQRSFVMTPPVVWGDFSFTVSKWAIGMSLAYIPILTLLAATIYRGDPTFQQIPYQPGNPFNIELLINEPYRASSWLNPLVTATTVLILYLLARRLKMPANRAYLASLLLGIASPAAVYAKFDFAQPLAALLLLLTLLFMLHWHGHRPFWLVLAGFCLGLASLTRTEFLLFPAPFLAASVFFLPQTEGNWSFWSQDRRRNGLLFTTPVGLFVLVHLYLNQIRFGSLLSVGYSPTSEFNFTPVHIIIAFIGNLFSPGRGCVVFFPLTLFAGWGLVSLFRKDRWAAYLLGGTTIGLMLLYATWNDWGGGISWGPRFLIPILPYLVLLGVQGFFSLRWPTNWLRTVVFILFILSGFVATLQGLLFNFLDFFGQAQLTPEQVVTGYYNFQFQYSPLFASWQGLTTPEQWDIFWLRNSESQPVFLMTAVICIILLSFTISRGRDHANSITNS
jgi:hypothetical protein